MKKTILDKVRENFPNVEIIEGSFEDVEKVDDGMVVSLIIGSYPDKLTRLYAISAAATFLQVKIRAPTSPIILSIDGADDDPRELWEIPEVCQFAALFLRILNAVNPSEINALCGTNHDWLCVCAAVYENRHN